MNFENIHKNKKWAFVDGFLTALVVVFYTRVFKKQYDEYRSSKAMLEENVIPLKEYGQQP